jgi:hypothetical protein
LREESWERVYRILSAKTISVDLIVKEVANVMWKQCHVHKACSPDAMFKEFQLLKNIIDEGLVLLENGVKYLDKAF